MKRVTITIAATCIAALALASTAWAHYPAQGNFGIHGFDVTFTNQNGTPATQAGSHPFAMTTTLLANLDAEEVPEGRLRDLFFEQIPGLVGDTTAYPRCKTIDFLEAEGGVNLCPLETTVGISASATSQPGTWTAAAVFNLEPPPGVLLRLGFRAGTVVNIVVDVAVSHEPPYRPTATSRNTVQIVQVFGNRFQLWGDPSDPAHDELRGKCGVSLVNLPPEDIEEFEFENQTGESCPVPPNPKPFLTLPTTCAEALSSDYEAISWEGDKDIGSRLTHDQEGNPLPFSGCGKLGFAPSIEAKPTSKAAQSPTGLDLSLDVKDEGLQSLSGIAQSDIRKVVLTLPQGMTANPSLAEGLEVCSESQLAGETIEAEPGDGCPQASKIGTVEVQSPLVEEPIYGALYQAEPYANLAEDAFLAFYIVIRNPKLGIVVKQPAKVEADPNTGQLVGITDEIPQLPFSHFGLHFREGGRSPLISPPSCGTHEVKATITPWSGGPEVTSTSTFEILSGPEAGPCPQGTAPFNPGFEAGSINNAAGAYSPFYMRLTRRDGEQDMSKFSSILPPGVLGKLAGLSKCSDAAIAAAKARSGPHGGAEELAAPSCPASSLIGHTSAGAGVGSQLTYVPGFLYLAGPYNGSPLSVVSVTPAMAGPFDAGTVVVRIALDLNPKTAEVEANGAASDPIPHILKGIPLNVRDLRVRADRPDFILNPTSCEEESTRATLWGAGTALLPTGETPAALSARYQAAGCASLGFKPALKLKLKGGTKRGGHPALRAELRARPGDANIGAAVVTLPRSAFLDQAHIRTICTRVQFAAGEGNGAQCPKGAVYGHARAFTPLLDEPIEGPVYLRSSNNKLPDLVAALHGIVDIEVVGRIDSFKGGIRSTFESVPDAPVSRFVLTMQGGKKGLVVNSRNLCKATNRADVRFTGQNGKPRNFRPALKPSCKKKQSRKGKRANR